MAKNKRRLEAQKQTQQSAKVATLPLFTKRGIRAMSTGAFLAILGYCVLCYTDPAGQNWQSTLSPFLLICGYALIGVGITLKDTNAH